MKTGSQLAARFVPHVDAAGPSCCADVQLKLAAAKDR